ASNEAGDNPVQMSVQVDVGNTTYSFPFGVSVAFPLLKSAQMDVQLPKTGTRPALPKPVEIPGAVFRGLVVGASGPGGVIKPLAVHWPDAKGNFSILLPRSLRGRQITLWQNQRFAYESAGAVQIGRASCRERGQCAV